MENNYLNWFKKAEEDEFAGKEILKSGVFFAPACFHFQQMTEKYLKGLLIYHGKDFPKVHDLIEIEELLLNVEPKIKEHENELALLNRFYIETRYPGDYSEFTLAETNEALEAADKLKQFVLGKIK